MSNQNYGHSRQFHSFPSDVPSIAYPMDQPSQTQSTIPISGSTHAGLAFNHSLAEQSTQLLPSQKANPENSLQRGQVNPFLAQAVQRPPMRRRKITRKVVVFSALGLLLLVGTVTYALYQFVFKGPPDVTLYHVSMKSINEDIGGGGIAYPVEQLNIAYPFTANVLAVFVQPGDKVTPKQPLMQLDLSQVNAQYITQLNAEVAQSYQNMLSAKAYLNSVSATGNSVEIAGAQQQYANAQASYKALQDETSASSLHQGKITSSINGTVTAVNVYQGQSVAADHVLLTIFDESSIVIRTSMPLSDYGHVQINQLAQVIPSQTPGQTFNGKVISIIPNANAQSGTFEVRVVVENNSGILLPGMSAFVHIQDPVQALVVPHLAVLNPDMDSIVFVVHQQHVYIQHVQVSGDEGDTYIIGSGLHADDLIVLVGLSTLHDGQDVHITNIEN